MRSGARPGGASSSSCSQCDAPVPIFAAILGVGAGFLLGIFGGESRIIMRPPEGILANGDPSFRRTLHSVLPVPRPCRARAVDIRTKVCHVRRRYQIFYHWYSMLVFVRILSSKSVKTAENPVGGNICAPCSRLTWLSCPFLGNLHAKRRNAAISKFIKIVWESAPSGKCHVHCASQLHGTCYACMQDQRRITCVLYSPNAGFGSFWGGWKLAQMESPKGRVSGIAAASKPSSGGVRGRKSLKTQDLCYFAFFSRSNAQRRGGAPSGGMMPESCMGMPLCVLPCSICREGGREREERGFRARGSVETGCCARAIDSNPAMFLLSGPGGMRCML